MVIADLSYFEIVFRLLLAAFFGGVIGIEREKTNRIAGLRTHMLVCIGAALIMIVSQYGFQNSLRIGLVILDPSRVAAQVVSGIGFLGAGTILFFKDKIRGLTTAASLWAVAGVGLATGSGLYFASIVTTSLIFIVLSLLKPIERMFFKKESMNEIKFLIKDKTSLMQIENVLVLLNLRSQLTAIQIQKKDDNEIVELFFSNINKEHLLKISDEIMKIPGVEKIEMIM